MFVIWGIILFNNVLSSSASPPPYGQEPQNQKHEEFGSAVLPLSLHRLPGHKKGIPASSSYSPVAKNSKTAAPFHEFTHRNHGSFKASENSLELEEAKTHFGVKEISWRKCSAKRLTAYLHSDVKIRCEFWAPLGTNVTWYKNGELQVFEPHKVSHKQNMVAMRQIGVDLLEETLTLRRKYEFHLASYFYIPCMTEDYQGDYVIEVEVPSGQIYKRNFQLSSSGYSPFYSACVYRPIIVDFAKTIFGKEGEELHIPCRPSDYSRVAIIWKREDRELSPNDYAITDDGDLLVRNLTALDEGYFICELYYTSYDLKYDEMATSVKVVPNSVKEDS